MKKSTLMALPILLLSVLVFMLFQSQLALAGAKEALLLWFNTLIPTLLPFMILSGLLVSTNCSTICTALLHPLISKLFKTTKEGTFALVMGFLCGFPMGAKILSDFRKEKKISQSEANYLLGFCNNFSPMFLLGFLCPILNLPTQKILCVTLGSPLLYGFFLSLFRKKTHTLSPKDHSILFTFSMMDSAIMNSFSAMTKLGGYLILFGIFTKMVTALPAATIFKSLIISLTEVTNGIAYTDSLSIPSNLKAYILLPCICFGGCSGFAQTKTMIQETDLSLNKYIFSKTVCTILAALLARFIL